MRYPAQPNDQPFWNSVALAALVPYYEELCSTPNDGDGELGAETGGAELICFAYAPQT